MSVQAWLYNWIGAAPSPALEFQINKQNLDVLTVPVNILDSLEGGLLWKCFECQRPRLRDANICRTILDTLHFQTRLCGAALLRKQEKTGLMLRLFWRLLYIRPVIWLVDVTIHLTSICTIRWSEKSESWNCQKFQAVSERRHHSEFRTVDGIEIRPALLVRCEIGHVCMYV